MHPRMRLFIVVGALCTAIASATPTAESFNERTLDERFTSWSIGQSVSTTSGTVTGHAAPNSPFVSEYLGIPYGKSTAGSNRFAPPQAFTGTATISGSKFGPDCPINPPPPPPVPTDSLLYKFFTAQGQIGHTFSEACLNINVWTAPQIGETKKAVMMYIYGGSFQTGSSASPAYNGAILAGTEDVVVITFNYRTAFMGFAAPPGMPNYNYGLLDQRLAVEWARANVAKFGGDPTRITLFGQSAGSASVDLYSYAYTADPIVNAMIMESGAVGILTAGDPLATQKWYNVSAALGCGSTGNTVACVRGKSMQTVLDTVGQLGLGFVPIVDNVTVFGDYPTRGTQGKFIKRPILVGNNDNEAGLFNAAAGGQIPPPVQDLINADFTCPAGNAARWRSANGVKAWRYRYLGVWPNTAISADAGTWHGEEVAQIMGNAASISGQPDTWQEIIFATLLRSTWAAFAKYPDSALSLLGLPLYDPSKNTLIEFALNDNIFPTFVNSTQYDVGCDNLVNVLGP